MKKQFGPGKEEKYVISRLIIITKMLAGIVILLLAGGIFFATRPGTGSPDPGASANTTAISQEKESRKKASSPPAETQIVDGRDVETGLVAYEGLQLVKSTCTACHSSALILQNRFTREEWHEKIVWMQETQGLWDLGENETVILDYLAANYAPQEFKGRRRPLSNIEWYQLKD